MSILGFVLAGICFAIWSFACVYAGIWLNQTFGYDKIEAEE